jgi:hypothetical protein
MIDRVFRKGRNPWMKISIWLKDGSAFEDTTVAGASIKVDGQPFDINTVDKVDNAFWYTVGGAKIYRQQVTGSIQLVVAGVSGNLTIGVDDIDELVRSVS